MTDGDVVTVNTANITFETEHASYHFYNSGTDADEAARTRISGISDVVKTNLVKQGCLYR